MKDKILQVHELKTYFYNKSGITKAVDNVSFNIEKNEVFGFVGESGSGKTLSALSILRLVPYPGKIVTGEIIFNGLDLIGIDEETLCRIRGRRISIVFQDPQASLDPVFTIGNQMMEAVLAHQDISKAKAQELVFEYLDKVHILETYRIFHSYPHQLSGGLKQRALIAMALLNSPELLILDEPTTALDVTIQAQILDLLDELIEKEHLSALFISHDLGIIAKMCDKVGVMQKGRIVEMNKTAQLLNNPKDPYTVSLLESVKALL